MERNPRLTKDLIGMENKDKTMPLFIAVKGSIFDVEQLNLDAVAIFIPCGLTHIREEATIFLKNFGKPISIGCHLELFENETKNTDYSPKYFLVDRNLTHKIYTEEELLNIAHSMLTIFEELGVKRIGLNGIRTQHKHPEFPSPEAQLILVLYNLSRQLDCRIESIYLIDLRGGFNKAPIPLSVATISEYLTLV
jgi:hypothetical protein